jgi:hypothetical protein
VSRQTVSDGPGGISTSRAGEDTPILRPEQLRLLPERQALVVGENAPPIIAGLHRCIDGRQGRILLAELAAARDRVTAARREVPGLATRTAAAVGYARAHRLHPEPSRPGDDSLFTDRFTDGFTDSSGSAPAASPDPQDEQ